MTLLFIFDMDDVLYGYDWRVRMRGMAEQTGLPLPELHKRWWHDEGEWAAEAGVYRTAEQYLAAFETAIGQRIDEAEWVRVRASAMTVWPDSLDAVRKAAEFGQVTLLTNNGALAGKHLPTLAPELPELFGEHLFTSSHYGARKPDPAVFERVLDRYQTGASETFFVDDMPENIAGAESLGITSHLFTGAAALHDAIDDFVASRDSTDGKRPA